MQCLWFVFKPPFEKSPTKHHSQGDEHGPIVDVLVVLKQASFSVTLVEEGHGAGGAVVRDHKHKARVLRARAGLIAQRALFYRSRKQRRLNFVHEAINRLERKQPWRVGARHMFFKHLFDPAGPDGDHNVHCSFEDAQDVMRHHVGQYGGTPALAQAAYGQEALEHVQHKRAEISVSLSKLHDEVLALHDEIKNEEKNQPNHVTNFRYSMDDMQKITELQKNKKFKGKALNDLRERDGHSPTQPNEATRERILATEARIFPEIVVHIPGWLRLVSSQREEFHGVAFRAVGETSKCFLFVYAKQQPMNVHFIELYPVVRVHPLLLDCSMEERERRVQSWTKHMYTCTASPKLVDAKQANLPDEEEIECITGLRWCNYSAVTDLSWEPFPVLTRRLAASTYFLGFPNRSEYHVLFWNSWPKPKQQHKSNVTTMPWGSSRDNTF